MWDYDPEQDAPWLVNKATGAPVLSGEIQCTSEADARLIASAPDLLEALKEYIAAGENSVTATDDVSAMLRFGDADKAARAAIAKATGGAA